MSSKATEARYPRVFTDRFRFLGVLGDGASGQVFHVEEISSGRLGALKVFVPRDDWRTELRRFEQEAEIAARLDHPNLIGLLGKDIRPGEPSYLLYEYVPGKSLRELMDQGRVPPRRGALLWVAAIGEALAVMHDEELVHRDVKPGNILIHEDGRAFLGDFGLVRLRRSRIQTTTGVILGTPHYVAPEVWRGGEAGPAADQFALGVVLHELVLGQKVYPREGIGEILSWLERPDEIRVPSRDDLPGSARDALERALRKDPSERFDDIRDFAAALRATGSPQSTPRASPDPEQLPVGGSPLTAPARGRPRGGLRVLAPLLGLLALGVGAAAIAPRSQGPESVPSGSEEETQAEEREAAATELRRSLQRLEGMHPDTWERHDIVLDLARANRAMFLSHRVELAFGRGLDNLLEMLGRWPATERGTEEQRELVVRSLVPGLLHVYDDFQHVLRRTPHLLTSVPQPFSTTEILRIRETHKGLAERMEAFVNSLDRLPRPHSPAVLLARGWMRQRLGVMVNRPESPEGAMDEALTEIHDALSERRHPSWTRSMDSVRLFTLRANFQSEYLHCATRFRIYRDHRRRQWGGRLDRDLDARGVRDLLYWLSGVTLNQAIQCPDAESEILSEVERDLVSVAGYTAKNGRLRLPSRTRNHWLADWRGMRATSPRFRRITDRLISSVEWEGP